VIRRWVRQGTSRARATLSVAAAVAIAAGALAAAEVDKERLEELRDPKRPKPAVVAPGSPGTQSAPGKAPSDAIVLFDGKDLSQWVARGRTVPKGKDGPPAWKVQDGYMEVVPNSGNLMTKKKFADCQIHVEWATPVDTAGGSGQGRGNSGVILVGHAEVQVLDSYQNETYPDGMAGGIYHCYGPLVNPSLKPGEWQSFDIVYRAPRLGADGKLTAAARMTVLYNGLVVHNDVEVPGDDKEFNLLLQDHLNPVRFRNVWVRPLPPAAAATVAPAPAAK
jgi:hypothetical protein